MAKAPQQPWSNLHQMIRILVWIALTTLMLVGGPCVCRSAH